MILLLVLASVIISIIIIIIVIIFVGASADRMKSPSLATLSCEDELQGRVFFRQLRDLHD